MNIITKSIALLSFSSLFALTAQADGDHFEAIESLDIPSALCNLATYNAKLTEITDEDEIPTADMVKVHELTYTLENAIQKIQSELTVIAADLEEVHLSSETMEQSKVKDFTNKYMEGISLLTNGTDCSE